MGLTITPIRSRLYPDTTNEPHDELLDLGLPLREFNALARFGVLHVDDLEALMATTAPVPGIGVRGWEHIHEALRDFRVRRGEPLPEPRPAPEPAPPSVAPSRVAARVRSTFVWTVLEEQRLLAEIEQRPPEELPTALAIAADKRGVTIESARSKYHGLRTAAQRPGASGWSNQWLRRLHDEIAGAGDERDDAIKAWAARRRCTTAEIKQLLKGNRPEQHPTPQRRRPEPPPRPLPRPARSSGDELADMPLPRLLDLDRRLRAELEKRVTQMTSAMSPA